MSKPLCTLVLFVTVVASIAVACDDGSEPTSPSDTQTSNGDAAIDTTEADGEGDDDVDSGCEPLPSYSGEPIAAGGACSPGDACERGTVCRPGVCKTWAGCAGRPDVVGCIIGDNAGGVETQVECTCDAHCAESPHGAYCVQGACHETPACDADGGCPSGLACRENALCVDPAELP